jgi:uncharacterized SAM-binding protein YcdF (DUF218 family)
MYFVLSKILLFLILPMYWVLAIFIIALVTKNARRKRRLFIAAIILLYIFSNSFIINQFAKRWDYPQATLPAGASYSCVIVLGGFSGGDEFNRGYFNTLADRFIQGVKLLITKRASHILISGGDGSLIPQGFREAAWVKTQLLDLKIPDSLILIEQNSKNTIENARFSKVLLQQNHLQPPYLLVTSAFHMRRAAMIFKNAGIPVIPYPCNYLAGIQRFSLTDLLPTSDALSGWNLYTKEVVGYVVNYFK